MEEHDPQRQAARYRVEGLAGLEGAVGADDIGAGDIGAGDIGAGDVSDEAAPGTTGSPTAPVQPAAPKPPSMAARGAFADELVRQAMARGEFDDLPLRGKPIPGLSGGHDPDWWLKAFIEREQITGVLPEALQLRKDDAALDDRLDREYRDEEVRQTVEEFNARVVEARRQLLGGPPVVTPTRDVEAEVTRWRERRRSRESQAATRGTTAARDDTAATVPGSRPRWWRRAVALRWRPER